MWGMMKATPPSLFEGEVYRVKLERTTRCGEKKETILTQMLR